MALEAVAQVALLAVLMVLELEERQARHRPDVVPRDGRVNDPVPALPDNVSTGNLSSWLLRLSASPGFLFPQGVGVCVIGKQMACLCVLVHDFKAEPEEDRDK
jgi:hypothetical protein